MDKPTPDASQDQAMSEPGPGTTLRGPAIPGQEDLLPPAALAFLSDLHRRFEPARQARLIARRWTREQGADIPVVAEWVWPDPAIPTAR